MDPLSRPSLARMGKATWDGRCNHGCGQWRLNRRASLSSGGFTLAQVEYSLLVLRIHLALPLAGLVEPVPRERAAVRGGRVRIPTDPRIAHDTTRRTAPI